MLYVIIITYNYTKYIPFICVHSMEINKTMVMDYLYNCSWDLATVEHRKISLSIILSVTLSLIFWGHWFPEGSHNRARWVQFRFE